jgi:hypothetical protein
LIKELVPLIPAELMLNISECGFSDWEERKPKSVLISCRVNNVTLHSPVDRGTRHQTVICCVTMAGDVYCPLLVSGYQSVRQIFETEVPDGIDLKVEIASSPYVTQAIFNKYIDEVLIPAVILDRGLPGCKDKPAILFSDNRSVHCSNELLGNLTRCGILVITYPPHTSHIFQVLDVLLFGILKKVKKYHRRDHTLRREVNHVLRLFRAYEQATASMTIKASWLKTGFDYETRDAATYLTVNETKIRQSDAFREV